MMRGEVTPVFFGSAMTNFGVELFLDRFVTMAPPPGIRLDANRAPIEATDERFSAFVFKIQANMDRGIATGSPSRASVRAGSKRDMTVRNVP